MKDLKYLCETIGIEPVCFYMGFDEDDNLVLRSDFTTMRQLKLKNSTTEKKILKEAMEMYKNGIAVLIEEYAMMLRHYETYYDSKGTHSTGAIYFE
jgi:hypothetical protein